MFCLNIDMGIQIFLATLVSGLILSDVDEVVRCRSAVLCVKTTSLFIMCSVSCDFDLARVNVVACCVSRCSCVSWKNAIACMWVKFCAACSSFSCDHWGTKCLCVFQRWLFASPCFVWSLVNCTVVCSVTHATEHTMVQLTRLHAKHGLANNHL